MVVPATAAKDPEKRRTSPRTEPPLSPAFLYSSRVSSDRMKLLMKSSSSDTSNSDFTISCASSTFRQQNISPCHVWDFCHLPIIQLVLHLFDQTNQVKTALQHLGKPPYKNKTNCDTVLVPFLPKFSRSPEHWKWTMHTT